MNPYTLIALLLTLSWASPLAAQGITPSEQRLFEKLVVAEAGGEGQLGMALVARSVLNRTALLKSKTLSTGTYLARSRSISGVINGRLQYEPVSSGTINKPRSAAKLRQAREAIALARNTPALRAALRRRGLSQARIDNLLRATGFRTKSAYQDSSQNYDRTVFGNHVFNTDRFSRREDVGALFERYFASSRQPARQPLAARSGSGVGIAGALEAAGNTSATSATRATPAREGKTSELSPKSPAAPRLASLVSTRDAGRESAPASTPAEVWSAEAERALIAGRPAPREPQATDPVSAWQSALAKAEEDWKRGGPLSPAPSLSAPSAPRGTSRLRSAPRISQSRSAKRLAASAGGAAGEAVGSAVGKLVTSAPPNSAERSAFARFQKKFGVLKLGSRGAAVSRLQGAIGVRTTGFFGIATRDALQAWQRARALQPSGEVDLATYAALRAGAQGK